MNKHVALGITTTTILIVATIIFNFALPKTSMFTLNQLFSIAILFMVIYTSVIYLRSTQPKTATAAPQETLASNIITMINQGVITQDKKTQQKLAELKEKTKRPK